MAKDNSVIIVPAISGITVSPKINFTRILDEDFRFHLGVYVEKNSLSKVLPKSLVRIWKKGNKIYVFDRNTSNLDYALNKVLSNNNNVIENINNSKVYIKNENNTRTIVKNGITGNTQLLSVPPYEVKEEFNRTIETKSNFNIVDFVEQYKNKKLNLYSIKPEESTRLSEFGTDETIGNYNSLLKIKSLFADEESIYPSQYQYKYFLSNIILPKLDLFESNQFTEQTFAEKYKKLKNIVSPLLEPNLVKVKEFNIISSRLIEETFDNETIDLQYINLKLLDLVQDHGEGKYFTLIKNLEDTNNNTLERFIINETNYANFINKIIILRDKSGYLSAIKINNDFVKYKYLVGNSIKIYEGIGFSYTPMKIFDKRIIPIARPKLNNTDALEYVESFSNDLYSIKILNEEEYAGFVVQRFNIDQESKVLELTIDEDVNNSTLLGQRGLQTFNTNTEGDYYVLEIE